MLKVPDGTIRILVQATERVRIGDYVTESPYLVARIESMPDHLVPSGFVVLDALPMTPHGKLDRAALPAPQPARAVTGRAPRSRYEVVLGGLFAELLGLPLVGVDEDFFELGGHSLLAAQLAGRIRSLFGIGLSIRTVFESRNVAGLASVLDGAHAAQPGQRKVSVAGSIQSEVPVKPV